MNRFLLPLLFFVVSAHSELLAQKKWSLQECVDRALEKNINVQQSLLEVEAAQIDRLEAIGNFLPVFNANANYSRNTGANINPATNQFENETFASASGSVNTGLSLFNGLANWKSFQRARLNQMASRFRLDQMRDDTALLVANSYLQILFNKEQLKVLKAQLEVTRENLSRTRDLIAAGQLPAGDVFELEANEASQEQQLIRAENELTIAKIGLAQTLMIDDYAGFDVVDESQEVPLSLILEENPKVIANKSKEVVNDLRVARFNSEIAQKDLELSRSGYYPRLNVFFGYNTRWAESIPLSFTDQLWIFDGTAIGLQLQVPILNGFSNRARVQRSKINLKRQEVLEQQAEFDLERNVYQAYTDAVNAKQSYEAAAKTLRAREQAYEFANERYLVGVSNAFEFNQALNQLSVAQAELTRSKYDYIFRLRVLEFYFGVPLYQKS